MIDDEENNALVREHDRLLSLVELAARMRQAQKKYFKSRDGNDLINAKALESDFDRALRK